MTQEIIAALKNGTFCPKRFRIFRNGAGRKVYIKDEYATESSRAVRAPSHAFPWSEFKHAFTKKYQQQLLAKLEAEAQQSSEGLNMSGTYSEGA